MKGTEMTHDERLAGVRSWYDYDVQGWVKDGYYVTGDCTGAVILPDSYEKHLSRECETAYLLENDASYRAFIGLEN